MPGGSKKGGGLEVKSAYKKQAYGEAKSPFELKSGNTTSFKLMGGTEKSPAKAKRKTYSTKEEAPKENEEKKNEEETDDLSGTDFFGQPTKKSEKDALEIWLEKHLETRKHK